MSDPIFARPITNPYPGDVFADIDGDGDLDILGISYDGYFGLGGLVEYTNTGTTTTPAFAAATGRGINFEGLPLTLSSLVDIDGDGDLDAFLGNASGNTIFARNIGTTAVPNFGGYGGKLTNPFGLTSVGSTNTKPKFVDIDRDGDLDAFIALTDGNTVFFRNTGTATAPAFAAAETNPFGLTDAGDFSSVGLTFADIDGDGDLDAFFGGTVTTVNTNIATTSPAIFFRNTGTTTAPSFAAAETNPFGLTGAVSAVVDIDGDSDLDIFADGKLYRNTLTGTSISTARNDFNNDGKSDILWRNDYGSVAVWQMNGATVTSGNLTSAPDLDPSWKAAGTGDFNGDGKTDILWRNTDGAVVVWTMDGSTVKSSSLTSTPTLDKNWTTAGTGDYNGDGRADILWRNTNGAVVVWTMDGAIVKSSTATFTRTLTPTSTSGSTKIFTPISTPTPKLDNSWKVAGNSDLDGDGKADILWRNDDGSVALWQMDGAKVTTSTAISKLSTDWKIAGTGDFNGDSKADILWRNDDGRVVLWQMNGAVITSSNLTSTPSRDSSQTIASISDYNGDGKADILWRKDTGAVEVWQMNGATVVSSTLTSVAADGSNWKIAAPII
jgi:FG-GAP-like repeat